MRILLISVVMFLVACSGATTRRPVEAPGPEPAGEPAGEAPPPAASAEGSTLDPEQQRALESLLRGRLEEFDFDVDEPELTIALLGGLAAEGGPVAAYRVEADGDSGSGASTQLLIAILVPVEAGHLVGMIDIGISQSVPGSEETVQLDSFEGLRIDHDLVRAEIASTTGSAEFDTCSDCQGRRQWATIRQRSTILCPTGELEAELGCALVPTAGEVVTPGVVIDSDGSRHPMDDPDPEPYELSLRIIDAQTFELSLVSGTLPRDQEQELGRQNLQEYTNGGVLYPDDE